MKNTNHFGGNSEFWQDQEVKNYNHKQRILNEQKENVLATMVRIAKYFILQKNIDTPVILDIGCGQGALTVKLLEEIGDSKVIAVDSSEQMLAVANRFLINSYENRFFSYICDFNSSSFWRPEINNKYDIIVSSLALHYLSDIRMKIFFKEIYNNLKENGVFIMYVANYSDVLEIKEMEETFKMEFGFNNLDTTKRPSSFEEFKQKSIEIESKANINWKSTSNYLELMKEVGFEKCDIVWYLWSFGIYVGLK